MLLTLENLESQIFALPRKERGMLVNRLIQTLDADEDIEQAWQEEIERRSLEVSAGRVQMRPMSESMAELRAEFKN